MIVALLGPVSQIIKARFLKPAELGAVAVLMIVYGLVRTIENAGLGQSMVQKEEFNESDRFTYLIIAFVFGLIGSVGLFILSYFIENIVSVPGSALLIKYSSPLLFFAVFDQFFRALLHRELLFRGAAITETIKRIVNIVLLMLFLSIGFGAQAVVFALIGSTLLGAIFLGFLTIKHRISSFQISWSASALKQLKTIGLPIAGKQIFTYITHRADEMVIAVALSAETLGIYHLAKETLQKLQSLVTGSFARVLLSLFSRIREDREKLSRVYARITLVVSYIGIPIFVGVALTAHVVVPAVFGTKWIDAVPAFRVLSLALIPIVLTANISTSLLYSVGKAKTVLLLDFAVNIPYLLILYIIRGQGLMPILITYLVYCFMKGIVLQTASNLQLEINAKEHIYIYIRVLIRVLFMVIVVAATNYFLISMENVFISALILVISGFFSMIIISFFTDKPALKELMTITSRT